VVFQRGLLIIALFRPKKVRAIAAIPGLSISSGQVAGFDLPVRKAS